MQANLVCLQCSLANFFGLMDAFDIRQDQVKEYLTHLAGLDYQVTPVELMQAAHLKTMELINNKDPYEEKKKLFNEKMLDRYDDFALEIRRSTDPLRTAIQLAIGGNVIDLLPKDNTDIDRKIEGILHKNLAVDHVSHLIGDLRQAARILYLTDNTGEIVLDKLLIETLIQHQIIEKGRLTVATRGGPIVNDATQKEAAEIGLTDLVEVIDNGDNAPGTVLKNTSGRFRSYFEQADVIISKGMGNWETLDDITDRRIYFLFAAKCQYAADRLGVALDDFLCMKNR